MIRSKTQIIFLTCLFFLLIFSSIIFLFFDKNPFIGSPMVNNTSITLGWIGPLSGSAKMLGEDNLNAVKLAINEYQSNKSPLAPNIKLVVEDDGYESSRTVT